MESGKVKKKKTKTLLPQHSLPPLVLWCPVINTKLYRTHLKKANKVSKQHLFLLNLPLGNETNFKVQ